MKAVADHVGIEFTDNLLKPTLLGDPFKYGSSFGFLDGIDKSVLHRKAKVLSKIEVEIIRDHLKPILEYFDYTASEIAPWITLTASFFGCLDPLPSSKFQVCFVNNLYCNVTVIIESKVGKNKAIDLNRPRTLLPITLKDRLVIIIGRKLNIKHSAISFVESKENTEAFFTIGELLFYPS